MESNINQPSTGMSFLHPSLLKNGQFSLLVNGMVQNVSGNFALISNDHSNILGSKFKEGFKVIGFNLVPALNLTFFFLTNPITLESEIGWIFDAVNKDKPDSTVNCSDCNKPVLETTPLEQTIQYPQSIYNTFVSAKCLNFDIDHPVTSWVKVDDCNVRIYFNDFKNPFRYIDYKNFPKIDLSNCPLIETPDLDCDKIKVFPTSCYPSLNVIDVVSGGQNKAGVYQFVIAYSDVRANKITDYYYVSNPIPLFDQPISVNTDYPVYKSFKIQVNNINTDFKYFNLAVLKTINNITTPYLAGTFQVKSNTFQYVYTGNDILDLSMDDILGKRPYYNKFKITEESNGYLFAANGEEDRILNLQPVVLNITPFWQTVELNDGDYLNPVIAQNYVGYLGDESYAKGIAFTKTNGKTTNVFPLVNRNATPYDLDDVSCVPCSQLSDLVQRYYCDGTPVPSGIPNPSGLCKNPDVFDSSVCGTSQIQKLRWQVYNTASVSPSGVNCVSFDTTQDPIEITDDIECYSRNIYLSSITVNPTTGEVTQNTTPDFWFTINDPIHICSVQSPCSSCDELVYPPTTSQDSINLYDCYLTKASNEIINLQNDTTVQASIGLCACDLTDPRFAPYIAQDPSATIQDVPLDLNPYSNTSSIEILQEDQVFAVNTYALPPNPNNFIPRPGNYPYTPNPCKRFVNDDKNNENGYPGWIAQKTNQNPTGAISLSQSYNANCNTDTWGAFIDHSDSWYSFYCTNQDGAAAILVSTENGGQAVDLYNSNPDGSADILNPPITPAGYTTVGNGTYALYDNLQYGTLYYIKVSGYRNPPNSSVCCGNLAGGCKEMAFRICVVSPAPATTTYKGIPGIARIVKTCKVTYKGYPENKCIAPVSKRGLFAYTESTETYPCNEEVWGDLAGKPIRHFKYPDHNIVPFFEESGATINNLSVKSNKIYPKGWTIDINQVKLALENAVQLKLITEEEKSQICGYRLYRSNRRGNQSVIAKGLLYDVWDYKDNTYNTGNKVLFPNFPFNDSRPNPFIKTRQIKRLSQVNDGNFLTPPNGGIFNNKYTFDSPNTSFNNPGLGIELKLECEQIGKSIGNYSELKNNAKYQYIGAGIISAALGFASVEAAFEALNAMVQATLTIPITILGSGTVLPLGLILAAVGENILSPMRIYSHYGEWYDIIKKFAPYRNYGVYYNGVGKYIGYSPSTNTHVTLGNTRRSLANTSYIKPGILNVKTTRGATRFNNFKRDSSVFLELDRNSIFLNTAAIDNSRQDPALFPCDVSTGITGDVASYYASLKNPTPNQYGQIDNIEWIDTGYNGVIEWNNPNQNTLCDTIFGGDTYINRFTKKRKIPMFLDDRVIPSGTVQVNTLNQDIQMSLLSNVGYPRYFMNFPTTLDYTGTAQAVFGDVAVQSNAKVDFNFLCFSSDGQSWKDAGLGAAIVGGVSGAAFGVISLPIIIGVLVSKVKRELGNDLYLKGKYIHSFYGITSFLCESDYNLDLRHGEDFKAKNFYPNVGDITEWTQEYFINMSEDNYYFYNNDYSKQNKENPNFILNNDYSHIKEDCKVQHPNRLIYSLQDNDQNDRFDGNLIFLANNYYELPKSLGNLQIVKGLSNGKVLMVAENGYQLANSYISQETNIGVSTVGSNSLFNKTIPIQSLKTDLGLGGSQTPAIANTEFGAYWVDNKRGQILKFTEGVENIIKPEEEWWFKENLPFHILEDFPEFDVTNNFKYVGMAITYDQRYKRIIFTKRDVELKPEYKGQVTYDGTFFHYKDTEFLSDNQTYFCNKSWSLSYNPLLKNFVSFHTFIPNYLIPNQGYFSSGYNYPLTNNPLEQGTLWYHNLTNKSWNTYQGQIQPFIFEYSIASKYQNKVLNDISYIAEYRRYEDNLSSYVVGDITYNKAIIFNQSQSTGLLELTVQQPNNRRQLIMYPIQKQNSRNILVDRVENVWHFNNFYDVSNKNGQPLMNYSCNNIAFTELNPLAIDYKPKHPKELMRSDYFNIRLINDDKSNFQILHRYSIADTNNSIT